LRHGYTEEQLRKNQDVTIHRSTTNDSWFSSIFSPPENAWNSSFELKGLGNLSNLRRLQRQCVLPNREMDKQRVFTMIGWKSYRAETGNSWQSRTALFTLKFSKHLRQRQSINHHVHRIKIASMAGVNNNLQFETSKEVTVYVPASTVPLIRAELRLVSVSMAL